MSKFVIQIIISYVNTIFLNLLSSLDTGPLSEYGDAIILSIAIILIRYPTNSHLNKLKYIFYMWNILLNYKVGTLFAEIV